MTCPHNLTVPAPDDPVGVLQYLECGTYMVPMDQIARIVRIVRIDDDGTETVVYSSQWGSA